jgi:hypothetical protein
MFVTSLGTVDPAQVGSSPDNDVCEPERVEAETPFGTLVQLAPPVTFSSTRPRWEDPILVPRGSSKPEWQSAQPRS